MQRIAYMDCESENVYNISKFLSLVNKMLCELMGDPNYIWNPRAIMTDENAVNKIVVGNILGEDLCKENGIMPVALSEMCQKTIQRSA